MTDESPGSVPPHEPTSLLRQRRLVELCLEFERAWRAGLNPRIEAFLERAGIVDRARLLGDLIAIEAGHRRRRGEHPTAADYAERFPRDSALIAEALDPEHDQSTLPDTPRPDPEPAAGVLLGGRYRLIGKLGSGSFAIVYAAHDAVLDRRVAVKVIRPQYARDPQALRRFIDEAQKGANLDHPGIVPIHDYGQLDRGTPYFVMRLVEGRNLKEELAALRESWSALDAPRRALKTRELLRRFLDVCDALAYGHEQKDLLHRDIKPANIMLSDYGRTFLVDWGLLEALSTDEPPGAPELEATAPYDPQEGRATPIVGTPPYMSPGAASGTPLERTDDLYSMGATLFSILTRGQYAVEGRTKWEVLANAQAGRVRWLRDVEPTAPRALAGICRKAMAFERKDRYPSATALADDVARWLAGEPVTAYREPIWTRAGRLARRHSGATAALALLPLVGMIALGVHNRRIADEHKLTQSALSGSDLARRDALASYNAALNAVAEMLLKTAAENMPRVPGTEQLRRDVAFAAVQQLDKLNQTRPGSDDARYLLARANRELANILRLLNAPGAEAYYKHAIEGYRSLAEKYPARSTYPLAACMTAIDRAECSRMAGRPDEAVTTLLAARTDAERFQKAFPEQSGPASRMLGRVALNLAAARWELGESKETLRLAEEAVTWLRPLADSPPRDAVDQRLLILALVAHGGALREHGEAEAGLTRIEDAQRRAVDLFGKDPQEPDACFFLALCRRHRGCTLARLTERENDAAEALDAALEALARIATIAPSVPHYREEWAEALFDRATLHARAGRVDRARHDAAQAAVILDALLGTIPNHPARQRRRNEIRAWLDGLNAEATSPSPASGPVHP
jgi:hypothetical protein